MGVVKQGLIMASTGVVAGAIGGYVLARLAGGYFPDMRMPDATPVIGSVIVLLSAGWDRDELLTPAWIRVGIAV